jgi:hypothetical protein
MSERVHTHRRTPHHGTRALAAGAAATLCASAALTLGVMPARAADSVTVYVSTTGSDAGTCLSAPGCTTLQRAVDAAASFLGGPFDVTVVVGAGTFSESASAPSSITELLTIDDPDLTSVSIKGAGANQTKIVPTRAIRGIRIAGVTPVSIEGVTISDATAPTGGAGTDGQPGGGILSSGSGALTLTNVALLRNAAGAGGAGTAGTNGANGSGSTATGGNGGPSTDGGDGGQGGGVAVTGGGSVTIVGSTIANNRAGNGGAGGAGGRGGDGRPGSTLPLRSAGPGGDGTAGSDGGAGGGGGGIYVATSGLTVKNSTVVLNLSGHGGAGGNGGAGGTGKGSQANGTGAVAGNGGNGGPGGGLSLGTGSTANLKHVTIAGNATNSGGAKGTSPSGVVDTATDGGQFLVGGLYNKASSVTLSAALLWNAGTNCGGSPMTTPSASVATDSSCFGDGSGPAGALNKVDATANKLGALADNGGPTPTVALATGNPAIGWVTNATCAGTPTDQRGKPRPPTTGAACSAGAFEPQPPPVAPTLQGVISSTHGATKFGWYRDTVTVTFTCTPGSSPLTAPCPSPMVLSTQGANQGGTVTITNGEGLSSSIQVSVNIDKGLPKIAIKGVRNGQTYSAPRKIRCVATDTLSGPYACQVTGTAKLITNNTQVRVKYSATAADKAGNIKTKKGFYIFNR